MGQEFFLMREDNRTLFELGKHTGGWREWLGRGNAIVVVDGLEETLAGLLALDIASWVPPGHTQHFSVGVDTAEGYAGLVTRRIVEWADGQPFWFASDDECETERWAEHDEPWPITGTRYL